MATKPEYVYAVLLYPLKGKPRVVEFPTVAIQFMPKIGICLTRADAEKALESFLVAHPKYRTWNNGTLHPEA